MRVGKFYFNEKNLNEVLSVKEALNDEYIRLMKMRDEGFTSVKFEQAYCKSKENLLLIDKLVRKAKDYMSIIIDKESDYDCSLVTIRFKGKNLKRRRLLTWLETNGYPTKSRIYNPGGAYDCTSKIYSVYFKLKNNVATIKYYYDV